MPGKVGSGVCFNFSRTQKSHSSISKNVDCKPTIFCNWASLINSSSVPKGRRGRTRATGIRAIENCEDSRPCC